LVEKSSLLEFSTTADEWREGRPLKRPTRGGGAGSRSSFRGNSSEVWRESGGTAAPENAGHDGDEQTPAGRRMARAMDPEHVLEALGVMRVV
jgi:hypothetical protein